MDQTDWARFRVRCALSPIVLAAVHCGGAIPIVLVVLAAAVRCGGVIAVVVRVAILVVVLVVHRGGDE